MALKQFIGITVGKRSCGGYCVSPAPLEGSGSGHTHREIHCCVWKRPLWHSVVPMGDLKGKKMTECNLHKVKYPTYQSGILIILGLKTRVISSDLTTVGTRQYPNTFNKESSLPSAKSFLRRAVTKLNCTRVPSATSQLILISAHNSSNN